MTFKELEFYPHEVLSGEHARYTFPNGYGISVINGPGTYSRKDTYEVAILHNEYLTYNTPLTNDVLADYTPEEINKLLAIIETWSSNQY